MSWTTPKFDWENGDYYNLADAKRIADNITYLRDMALQIYPSTVTCLVYQYGKNAYQVQPGEKFGICDITLSSLTTYDASYYTHETIPWFTYDPVNFVTLYKLLMLYPWKTPLYIENHDIAYDSTPIYYSGDAIVTRSGSATEMDSPQESLEARFPLQIGGVHYSVPLINHIGITTQWTKDSQGRRKISIYTGNSAFKNSHFWSRYQLDHIEQMISILYYRFTSFLGG